MSDDADIRVAEVTSVDAESQQMELIAKLAAQVLTTHYPNHWWMVGWAPGNALILKHGAGDARYGYSIDFPKMGSISEFEKEVMRGGGELLERMGLSRGAWDGEEIAKKYEGAERFSKMVH